jgi:hypothetical protein
MEMKIETNPGVMAETSPGMVFLLAAILANSMTLFKIINN